MKIRIVGLLERLGFSVPEQDPVHVMGNSFDAILASIFYLVSIIIVLFNGADMATLGLDIICFLRFYVQVCIEWADIKDKFIKNGRIDVFRKRRNPYETFMIAGMFIMGFLFFSLIVFLPVYKTIEPIILTCTILTLLTASLIEFMVIAVKAFQAYVYE